MDDHSHLSHLSSKEREAVLSRNGRQSAENAERRKEHERAREKFYDKTAETLEPIVYEQLKREGQNRKIF